MQKFSFPGSQGHNLAARIDLPSGRAMAYAIFAHCFTCSKDVHAAAKISRALTKSGIAVVRFDFTGLGASGGEFANTNFSSNVADLVKAADYMRKTLQAPSILIGHSLGGAAVLAAASGIEEVKAVVTIGAPSDVSHVISHFNDKEQKIIEEGQAQINLAGRDFTITRQFVEDLKAASLEKHISELGRALLVMHAPLDSIVDIENAAAIFKSARHPKSFITLDDADHLLTKEKDARYAADVIAAWVSRYLPETDSEEDGEENSEGEVLVKSSAPGKFRQHIISGSHELYADEPEEYGGDDTGPNPYDFLSIALGACKSMTMQMYAERKKLPLESVEVEVSHSKIHARDCANCETEQGKLDKFTCKIKAIGNKMTKEQRARLIEISTRCPVQKTLAGEVVIDTETWNR
jgi:putative redox protein